MPFVGWTVETCYEIFATHLRPLQNDALGRPVEQFKQTCFLAIYAACVSAIPPEIIVGTDAADFHENLEDPPKLKVIRLPIDEIMPELESLEMQTSTPSEVRYREVMRATVMPPPFLAGPADAVRAVKRSALQGLSGPVEGD